MVLRHQIAVLQRQLGTARPLFSAGDRAFLAAMLHRLPRGLLGRVRLLVSPDTVLRWHRDLLALGVKTAASTVWGILRQAGIDPAPGRSGSPGPGSSALRPVRCSPATSSRPSP